MKLKGLIIFGISALTSLMVSAQQAGDAVTLDTVTPDVLSKVEWIKGSGPTEWEPGKVYMFECWATWCLPCIIGIPHVDELYDKYNDKGFEVYGMDVFEDEKQKVIDFVEKKGDGMSYPVAFTGKEGPFEIEWLKPGGVNSIPRALIVKDGKVLLNCHPAFITDEVVEGLLAGGADEEKALALVEEAKKKMEMVGEQREAFAAASKKHDPVAMEEAYKKIEELDAKNGLLPSMKLQIKIAAKDWAAVESELMAESEDKRPLKAKMLASQISWVREDVPVELFTKLISYLTVEDPSGGAKDPHGVYQTSKLQWLIGEKETAIASAEEALELAKHPVTPVDGTPILVYLMEPYTDSLKSGSMPTEEELEAWLQDGIKKSQEARRAKIEAEKAAKAAEAGDAKPAEKPEEK